MDDVALTFDDKVLDYIVDKAIEYKLGARGLRSITEDIMIDAMFDLPSSGKKNLFVDLDYAKSKIETSSKLRSA
jgi:ATP-dependent Clp protease ATP-binding subunit ClpX